MPLVFDDPQEVDAVASSGLAQRTESTRPLERVKEGQLRAKTRQRKTMDSDSLRPFLKWAGGKRQLLPELMARISNLDFARYHEPFLGGGAFYFELAATGRLRGTAYLSDTNVNLVETYLGVQQHVHEVVERLQQHAKLHNKEYYYAVRAAIPVTLPERAARIIYLNRTCFNGLYRENSRGMFNVPMGNYSDPRICDEANLKSVSVALTSAVIETRDFSTVIERAASGDLVYFDPPYHPVSKTSSFTQYAKDDFGEDSQERLAQTAADLHTNGVHVLISNSCTEFVLDTFNQPGFVIDEVQANRAVNSKADRRGKVSEVLVRNF